METLEIVLSACLGIGLAAAAGFRVFVPPLILGIAIRLGVPATDVAPDWLGSWIAIAVFAVAAVVEVGAYYVPWLDNALDTVASPLAVLSGVLLTAGMTSELHPVAQWSLAIVAGGGAAGITQTASVFTRALSSATTGGLANFLVSTVELVCAIAAAVLTLLFAPLAIVMLVGFVVWLRRVYVRRRAAKARQRALLVAGA